MQKCIPLDNYFCFLSYNMESCSSDILFFNLRGEFKSKIKFKTEILEIDTPDGVRVLVLCPGEGTWILVTPDSK